MSMFFRSRSPRALRRKSRAKAQRKTVPLRIDLGPNPVPAPVPSPIAAAPRRRRYPATGYTMSRPRPSRFRVT